MTKTPGLHHQPSRQARTGPTALCPYGVPTYATVEDAIEDYAGDDQIYVLYPRRIEAAACRFLAGFPGKVLYALKANPHPSMIKILAREGVRHFDVASIREMELVRALVPDVRLYMMHPIKSRATIAHAYAIGIRDFAFDHADELRKILDVTETADDLTLHLRLALPVSDAVMPLAGKFGADDTETAGLLRAASRSANRLGVCFHVGSQCLQPASYRHAIAYACDQIRAAGVEVHSIDIGGGFPVAYPGMTVPQPEAYFDEIGCTLANFGLEKLEVIGEPGRALCAEGGSTLARIELRKGCDLYLNDGTYGSLFDAGQFAWKFPVALKTAKRRVASAKMQDFRFFGPTCDSADRMEGPFSLPDDAAEGDWVEIRHLGAYGQTLATGFNGFCSEHTVAVLHDAGT